MECGRTVSSLFHLVNVINNGEVGVGWFARGWVEDGTLLGGPFISSTECQTSLLLVLIQ